MNHKNQELEEFQKEEYRMLFAYPVLCVLFVLYFFTDVFEVIEIFNMIKVILTTVLIYLSMMFMFRNKKIYWELK